MDTDTRLREYLTARIAQQADTAQIAFDVLDDLAHVTNEAMAGDPAVVEIMRDARRRIYDRVLKPRRR